MAASFGECPATGAIGQKRDVSILINLEALNVQKHGHSWHSNSPLGLGHGGFPWFDICLMARSTR